VDRLQGITIAEGIILIIYRHLNMLNKLWVKK